MSRNTLRHLDQKGLEYRRVILAGMSEHFGPTATEAIMDHTGLRRKVNAAAQSAANAPTAGVAAAIATEAIRLIAVALDTAARGLAKRHP